MILVPQCRHSRLRPFSLSPGYVCRTRMSQQPHFGQTNPRPAIVALIVAACTHGCGRPRSVAVGFRLGVSVGGVVSHFLTPAIGRLAYLAAVAAATADADGLPE